MLKNFSIRMLDRCSRSLLIAVLLCMSWAAFAFNYGAFEKSVVDRFGVERVQMMRNWQGLLNNYMGLPPMEKSRLINDFVNQAIYWQDDSIVWGQADYWATPGETMGRGTGDCEDFSILKYFSLKEMSVPSGNLRMVYVKANQNGQLIAHMVLAYYPSPNAEPYIMDNLNNQLLPASNRSDLTPIYSFNSEGVWQGTSRTSQSGRISRWQDLLSRARGEGFF